MTGRRVLWPDEEPEIIPALNLTELDPYPDPPVAGEHATDGYCPLCRCWQAAGERCTP